MSKEGYWESGKIGRHFRDTETGTDSDKEQKMSLVALLISCILRC